MTTFVGRGGTVTVNGGPTFAVSSWEVGEPQPDRSLGKDGLAPGQLDAPVPATFGPSPCDFCDAAEMTFTVEAWCVEVPPEMLDAARSSYASSRMVPAALAARVRLGREGR